jgi:hypothetical protein
MWLITGCGGPITPTPMLSFAALRDDGGLTVAPILDRARPSAEAADAEDRNVWGERLGSVMQLPGSYVRESVSLGYASTKDAAQGRNVDTGHTVAGAGIDPAGLYVMSTRGRDSNTAYVVTRQLAADAQTGETFDVTERGPEDVLADILDRASSASWYAIPHSPRSANAPRRPARRGRDDRVEGRGPSPASGRTGSRRLLRPGRGDRRDTAGGRRRGAGYGPAGRRLRRHPAGPRAGGL